jgi:hypothetical protein
MSPGAAGFATGIGNEGLFWFGPVGIAVVGLLGTTDGVDDAVGTEEGSVVGARVTTRPPEPPEPPESPVPPVEGTVADLTGPVTAEETIGGAAGSTSELPVGWGRIATMASPMTAAIARPPAAKAGTRHRRRRSMPARICR